MMKRNERQLVKIIDDKKFFLLKKKTTKKTKRSFKVDTNLKVFLITEDMKINWNEDSSLKDLSFNHNLSFTNTKIFQIIKEDKKNRLNILFQTPTSTKENSEEESESVATNIKNFQKEIEEMNGFQPSSITDQIKQDEKKKIVDENLRRKFSTDSLHKKIKRLFFIFMHSFCENIFHVHFPKIPNHIITNVTIKFNKYLLFLNIKEFFAEYCNFTITPKELGQKLSPNQSIFLKCQIKDLYSLYIKKGFERDMKAIQKKESVLYSERFKERALILIDYFTMLEPFEKKFKHHNLI